jgi:hypothetical protein
VATDPATLAIRACIETPISATSCEKTSDFSEVLKQDWFLA